VVWPLLSVALLEQLIVFLAPRKRGMVREGAGLARGALLPMVVLMLLVAIGSAGADFRRIRSYQAPRHVVRVAVLARCHSGPPAAHQAAYEG